MLGLGDRGVAGRAGLVLAILVAGAALPACAGTAGAQAGPAVAGGLLGGALLGDKLETATSGTCYEECGLGGFLLGAVVGPALLAPVLSHAMGGRQGNLGAGILATALVTVGMGAVSFEMGGSLAAVFVTVPLSQAVTAILVEERTGRRR